MSLIMPDLSAERWKSSNIGTFNTLNSQSKRIRTEKDVNQLAFSTGTTSSINETGRNWEQPSENNLQKIKAEDTEQMKLYKQFFKMISCLGFMLGYRLKYDWVPKRYALYWFHAFCLTSTWFSLFDTVNLHFTNGNYVRILEPLSLLGITVSCTLNKFNFTMCSKRIVALLLSTRRLCRQNILGIRADIIKRGLRRTVTFMKIYTFAYSAGLSCYIIGPLYAYIVDNELISLLPVEIVFVDQSKLSGYIIANSIMALIGCYATLATTLYGLLFIICVCNYTFQVDLIAQDFKDLDAMWSSESNVCLAYKRVFLKNICKKRQDMNSYLNEVKDTHETKIYLFFCASYLSQIVCLYSATKNHWISGYGVLVILFIEMLFYCLSGTQISIADDRLCYIISDSNWYTYDLESQRTVMLILRECQQSKSMQLGPLGPLDVKTGIEIVKSIYSYYTVLTELL